MRKPETAFVKIPKNLHMIWVGPNPAPKRCIESWRDLNPSWHFRLWGDDEALNGDWRLRQLLSWAMANRKWSGASDMMRYEILFNLGGFYADADSTALRPLDDGLFETGLVASRSSELYTPDEINNAFLAAVPGHPVLNAMIEDLKAMKRWPRAFRWRKLKFKTVAAGAISGPALLKKHAEGTPDFSILPSWVFSPEHYAGPSADVHQSYAVHHWASMQKSKLLKNRKIFEAGRPSE
jgi:mannosyltransferase OCH1-like enzyme